jgi:hypothetical protein
MELYVSTMELKVSTMLAWVLVFLLLAPVALPQRPKDTRLPSGKSRNMAVLKEDFERSKKDLTEILQLAKELQEEVEKNEEFVVDLRSIRKAERLERLARNVKSRMKRLQ